jgi:hypothetical protein
MKDRETWPAGIGKDVKLALQIARKILFFIEFYELNSLKIKV